MAREKETINLLNKSHLRSARFQALKDNGFFNKLGLFSLFAIAILVILQSAHTVSSGLETKKRVLGTAQEGFENLKEAQELASEKNLEQAQEKFVYAHANFVSAKQELNSADLFLKALISLHPSQSTASHILDAGSRISQAGAELNNFYVYFSQVKVSAQGLSSPDGFYGTVNAAKKHLRKALDDLHLAKKSLDLVRVNQLPEEMHVEFTANKEKLNITAQGFEEVYGMLELFQQFIGQGNKSMLVLFMNNNELRPGGGFIGTYGYYKFSDGVITQQKVTSIYDFDGQLKDKIAPPGAFYELTDKWGLRDSNWFADFPASARKAQDFFELVEHETPDSVVAMTPDIFVDLLKVTGPIDFAQYGVVLTADNFRELVQLNTSVLYDKEQNAPKQMLADFAPLLLQELSELQQESFSEVFGVLISNFGKKNIMFYDHNPGLQTLFESYGWAGRITETDRDYLAVYNANLGGRKTDLSVEQKLDLVSEVQPDGSIVNTVTYTRNHLPNLYEQAKNIDYVRFLVPKGSTLISAEGFNPKPFHRSDGSSYIQTPGLPFKVDSDLAALDANTKIDALTGTATGIEGSKTFFANWIEVEPGKSATVTLRYKLPFTLNDTKKHSLVVQKQPGNNPIEVSYSFAPYRRILWYTPYDLKIENRKLIYRQLLNSDLFIGAVLDNSNARE